MLKNIIKDELETIEQVVADAFKYWRTNYAKLSQQNIHDFCKAKNIPVYNSQIAYLEKANLDAKRTMYFGLEHMNKELADKNNKFLYVENKNLREKLIAAEPFLTHDDRVANKFDFAAMMLGEKINKKYMAKKTITDELALQYTKLLREEFHNTRRELMVSGKELVEILIKTKVGKKAKEKDVNVLKDVLTEEYDFTGKHLTYLMSEYGTLPCFSAIDEVKPNSKLEKFCKEIGL
tara:strand:- start:705 stop:1409 length:705 start_codon:yes stop_codon:yes gene_type:complete